ncbi:MAG: 50S ribosomal protein L3 [Candidatus Woesearchaeota archaeon]
MAKKLNPRHGSMQYWPRVRAKRQYPRIRSLPSSDTASLLGFAGYKAGMTQVVVRDNDKNSMTRGELVSLPATVIECPPLRLVSLRLYRNAGYGREVSRELFFKPEKFLSRKSKSPGSYAKADDLDNLELEGVKEATVVVHTQPSKLSLKKKTPEVFEFGLGGSLQDKIAFVKQWIGKDIPASEVLKEGVYTDLRAVTKGKGTQGPVKRFGIGLRPKKSEKTIRGPGSLGGWIAQGHSMYRISHAGTMGYHQRIQYNNYILSISDDLEKVNPDGGFINYGPVKNTYVLVKGSVPGPKKRLVALTNPLRKGKQFAAPTVESINTQSKQGN